MKTLSRFRSRKGGFTLVEILVVVSLIGILAAILFPVIVRARESGRRTTCLGNERQMGTAFKLYEQDYDERLPQALAWTASGVAFDANGAPATWDVVLQPYLKSLQTLQCPDDTSSVPFDVKGLGKRLYRSYCMLDDVEGRHLSEIPAPAATVLLEESFSAFPDTGTDPWQFLTSANRLGKETIVPEWPVISEFPEFRHNECANFLFMDTHVKTLKGPHPNFPGYRTDENGIAQAGKKDPMPQ